MEDLKEQTPEMTTPAVIISAPSPLEPPQKKKKNVKLCSGCNVVRDLETEFYRSGAGSKYFQKLCKECHNRKRIEYPFSKAKYKKKDKGFAKLPKETQAKIIYGRYVKVHLKKLAQDLNLNYQTLCVWSRKGLIPEYNEPEETAQP